MVIIGIDPGVNTGVAIWDLKTNSFSLWLKGLPLSLGGALIFLIFMLLNNKDYFSIFFIVLSCISMPHIISMHKFYQKNF